MKLRWRGNQSTQEGNATVDPVSAVVWEEGHLTGPTASAPVIKAPRAGDVVARHAG